MRPPTSGPTKIKRFVLFIRATGMGVFRGGGAKGQQPSPHRISKEGKKKGEKRKLGKRKGKKRER